LKFNNQRYFIYFIILLFISLGGCAGRKSGKEVSFMKNLTAHYNIYYNASELLKESEKNIQFAYKDNYDQLLPIFPLPGESSSEAEQENLNEVINKANRIALEKFESNWVDDAFLLLAKAEYLKGNYYNAAEYFSYVSLNFPDQKENTVEALVWQGKSLFALEEDHYADSVLHFAYDKNLKYHRAVLNAALANSYIRQDKPEEAIVHLKKAIGFTKNRYEKIRWTFILAQLLELTNNEEEAFANYAKVVKSNASFEMSFNANLSQIRLRESASGIKFDKVATLTRLLKEDKNKEFQDQIYYQIAETYRLQGQLDLAAEFYETSAHVVPGTLKQKGLSYLKLAEINFDSLKNYARAQLYYDSTLQSLPKEYPDYKNIAIKAENLQYLADRLTLIEKQEELLMLAGLSEEARISYADEQIKKQMDQQQTLQTDILNVPFVGINDFSQANKSGGTFYFDNSMAISQGLNEFKKRWGNRKLEDNWRISSGVSNLNAGQNTNNNLTNNAINNDLKTNSENIDSLRNNILEAIPLTANDQAIAENKIKIARYEIAMFYKDVLGDHIAAIEALEQLIPSYRANDPKVAELYFQLYRLNEPLSASRSEQYKQELIRKYPESIFARSLINPDFGKEEEAALNSIKKEYAAIYDSYQRKNYSKVIADINALEGRLTQSPTAAAQFQYLKSLAIGHTQKAPVFVASLNEIVSAYPNDSLVTSLVKSQLSFIEKNKETFYNRPTALLAYDANERIANNEQVMIPKLNPEENIAAPQTIAPPGISKPVVKTAEPAKSAEVSKPETSNNALAPKPIEPEKPKLIAFSNNARIKHVIVIDIKNSTLNVAKPFAALTKYFYSKFDPSTVNLTIRTIGSSDKLITVRAQFNTKDQAEKALAELRPSLKEILSLDAKEYASFVISEANLLLINNSESLNQYLNYNK
jgi:hypothetical protein